MSYDFNVVSRPATGGFASVDTGMARMSKYMLEQSVSCPIIIEADTEIEARDQALDLNPDELDWDVVEYHVFETVKITEEPM